MNEEEIMEMLSVIAGEQIYVAFQSLIQRTPDEEKQDELRKLRSSTLEKIRQICKKNQIS